jgi:hypothetical protein
LVFPFVRVETYLTRNFTTVPATRVKKEAVPARVKKEPPVKTDVKDEPASGEDELPWCVKELKMADAARYPDDPADEPGLHPLLQAGTFKEAQPLDEATAVVVHGGQRRRRRPHQGRR